MPLRASVVISTYNQPRYLELALLGFARQSCRDFELIVADDGSSGETREVLLRYQRDFPVPLRHAWQPDEGFRKARAVNRGVLLSRGRHLLFSDGDCVPAGDFVAQHLAVLGPNTFAAGGPIRLSRVVSDGITGDDVRSGAYEALEPPDSLRARRRMHRKNLLYLALGKRRKPKFYGLNFSVDRASFFAVNGFDQTYAGSARDDSDLRNRMRVAGVRPRCVWHTCRVFHLWHPYHDSRDAWADENAYYHRQPLPARAPRGLLELAAEEGLEA